MSSSTTLKQMFDYFDVELISLLLVEFTQEKSNKFLSGSTIWICIFPSDLSYFFGLFFLIPRLVFLEKQKPKKQKKKRKKESKRKREDQKGERVVQMCETALQKRESHLMIGKK